MTIFTDKRLKHNRPDIIVVHKDTQQWTIIDIAMPADQNILTTEVEKVQKCQDLDLKVQKNPRSHESDNDTYRGWCTWNYIGECKGLLQEVESTRYFWKRTIVSHPWYCPYLAESVMSSSCRIVAETWLRIPTKRTGEDYAIIIMTMIMIIVIRQHKIRH